MATFVLVHGGWHGAWCWARLRPMLAEAGHRVVAPDLPGHGNDATPLSARPYARYVPALGAIVAGQAEPVILVGHSSGGMSIGAVAAAWPQRVRVLVYLAAFLLPPGVAPPVVLRDDTESFLAGALVRDVGTETTSVPPERARAVFYGDCTDADAAWAIAQLQPEPIVPPMPASSRPTPAPPPDIPRVYIETLHDRALGPATQRKMYTAMPCERVFTLPTDHSPFLSAPRRLADCLTEIAAAYAPTR